MTPDVLPRLKRDDLLWMLITSCSSESTGENRVTHPPCFLACAQLWGWCQPGLCTTLVSPSCSQHPSPLARTPSDLLTSCSSSTSGWLLWMCQHVFACACVHVRTHTHMRGGNRSMLSSLVTFYLTFKNIIYLFIYVCGEQCHCDAL